MPEPASFKQYKMMHGNDARVVNVVKLTIKVTLPRFCFIKKEKIIERFNQIFSRYLTK